MNIQDMIRKAAERLEKSGVDSPNLSARILAAKVLFLDELGLVMQARSEVSADKVCEYESLILRRESGEPTAYILSNREFYGLDFEVNPDVLIPRPETEELVELVQKYFSGEDKIRFADFGTGSGIIAVTIASLLKAAHGVALDISFGACRTAARNAAKHGVNNKIDFIQADFTTTVLKDAGFDLVMANPPYLSEQELCEVSREVADFEPSSALVGGPVGDELIRKSAPVIGACLKSGGMMFMEIGYLQGPSAVKIFEAEGLPFCDVHVVKDLSGHDRIVVAKKR